MEIHCRLGVMFLDISSYGDMAFLFFLWVLVTDQIWIRSGLGLAPVESRRAADLVAWQRTNSLRILLDKESN